MIEDSDLSQELKDFLRRFSKDKAAWRANYWLEENVKEIEDFKRLTKNIYIKKQNYTCVYCRQKIVVSHNASWDLEHIVSRNENPRWMFDTFNLCIACKDCNNEKSDNKVLNKNVVRDIPKNSEDYKIYHPYIDDYKHHITVVSSGEFYIPETKKGRNTIRICGLDRFFLKIAGVGKSFKENAILIGKIVKLIEETEDQEKVDKLYKLIEILAGNSRKIINDINEKNLENALEKILSAI